MAEDSTPHLAGIALGAKFELAQFEQIPQQKASSRYNAAGFYDFNAGRA